jgi:hypothetical protein
MWPWTLSKAYSLGVEQLRDKSKFLIIIDEFELYELGKTEASRENFNHLLNKLYEYREKKYKNRVSILISCRDNAQDNINLLGKFLRDRKSFSQYAMNGLELHHGREYLKLVLSIEKEEEPLFDEFFDELIKLSHEDKRLKQKNSICPFYVQLFGEVWKYIINNGSRMTLDKIDRLKIDGRISINQLVLMCFESINAPEAKPEEISSLYYFALDHVENSPSISSEILRGMKLEINQFYQKSIFEAVETYIESLLWHVREHSTILYSRLREQREDRRLIEEIVGKILEGNLIAPQIIHFLEINNQTLYRFIKQRNERYESLEMILLLLLYSSCNGSSYPCRKHYKSLLPAGVVADFNAFTRGDAG